MMRRWLLLLVWLLAAWCVMVCTHESGHVVAGWLGGGTLQSAELRPWRLPYSVFDPNPRPLITLWAGPLLGVLVPVALARLVRKNWMWFIANFCLLANGGYLAVGWISGDRYLDTTQLLAHGAHPGLIVAYCALTIGWGYVGFRRETRRLFAVNVTTNA